MKPPYEVTHRRHITATVTKNTGFIEAFFFNRYVVEACIKEQGIFTVGHGYSNWECRAIRKAVAHAEKRQLAKSHENRKKLEWTETL